MDAILVLAGLALLAVGGEQLVRGATGLGRAVGLSPVVVGAVVVAPATSAPELVVSLDAALTGSPGLAVGNAVGSSTVNILLVLGVAALVRPQTGGRSLLRYDLPVALAVAVAVLLLGLDGSLGPLDGVLLLAGLVAYLVGSVVRGRRSRADRPPEPQGSASRRRGPAVLLVALVAGAVLLVVGAEWLVDGATRIAAAFGLGDLVIGLTVVAVGTAMPEIAASVVAAARGDSELALGNVIGSNVANLGLVLGVPALVTPGGLAVAPSVVRVDVPVLLAATVGLGLALATGAVISRREAVVLLVWFVVYTAYLILEAAGLLDTGPWAALIWGGALPITLVLAVAPVVRQRWTRARA